MVIKADSLHYQIDLYTNFAVIFSLITVYFTDNQYIDAAIGGLIAIYIIYSAYELIYNGVNVLLDKAIDENIVNNIIQIINDETEVNDYHLLKTRESANVIFIEVHLVFNCLMTLMQAHKISDDIEIKIEALDTSKKWVINMHLDPYDDSIVNTTSP
jgi:cation diffusion facilitator family transporter